MDKIKTRLYCIYGVALIGISAFCTVFSSKVSAFALKGIKLCAGKLIPSIFPILVINGLLIRSGIASRLSKWLEAPFKALTGAPRGACVPFILGVICGCPSGAAAVDGFVKTGELRNEDVTQTLIISSSISTSFIIGFVGLDLLFSPERGIALWLFQLISAIAVGRLFLSKNKDTVSFDENSIVSRLKPINIGAAVKDAVGNMLVICGNVVFFSAVIGIVSIVPFVSDGVFAIISAFFEMTNGVSALSSVYSDDAAFILICGGLSWSGLSMILQMSSFIEGRVSVGKLMIGKALCSLCSIILAFISVMIEIV